VGEWEPFGGPLTVEIGGETHPLGLELAERIRVTEVTARARR